MVAGMMLDNRISQTTGPGWGILILSFPTSNFQCLCSVEPLLSVRAEQMPVLMDLLNHKNCLRNCIWLKQENVPLFRKISLQRLTETVGGAEMQGVPRSCGVFLHGKDVAPFMFFSLPQVSHSSAFPDEREIDMSHFKINLCNNILLAAAERAWQGTTS